MSYKHFGRERGEEIGEVVIFDSEQIDADPVLAASATEVNGATVIMVPFGHESPGITELGYKTRREAEAIAEQHGVPLSEHRGGPSPCPRKTGRSGRPSIRTAGSRTT